MGQGTYIGLDIGSSAVRAAEVRVDGDTRTLLRYAQVGLSPGVVVDGEVVDVAATSTALRRLWDEGGFSSRRVILGVSSQRVIVRPAEVAAMPADEFRVALQFEANDLIPMPADEAVLDFVITDPVVATDAATGHSRMRILLVAADREMIRGHLEALKPVGLHPIAVDVVPLALLRVVPAAPPGDLDAVVCLGADLTTVAVRQNDTALFARTVNFGGSKLTNSIAVDLDVEGGQAEALKRSPDAGGVGTLQQVRRVLSDGIQPLISEVDGSLDYFLAQSERRQVDRVLVTGGASRTRGLLAALEAALNTRTEFVDPFRVVSLGDVGLSQRQVHAFGAEAMTPIGIALWGAQAPQRRLTLLPPEVVVARRNRRVRIITAASLVALAAALGVTTVVRDRQVSEERATARAVAASNAELQSELNTYAQVTMVDGQLTTHRQLAVTALTGDINWITLLSQVAAALPPGMELTTFTGSASAATSTGTSSPPVTGGTPGNVGTVTFGVTATGGQDSVAEWLRAMGRIPALQNVWVASSTVTANGAATFSSTATLGPSALSQRAKQLPSGSK